MIDIKNSTWNVSNTRSVLYAGDAFHKMTPDERKSTLKGAPVVMATNCLMDCIVDFEDAANQRIYDAVLKEMGEIYIQCSPELNKEP